MFATILAIALMSIIEGWKDEMVESIISNTTGHLQIQDVLYHDESSIDHALEYEEEVKQTVAKYGDDIKYTVPRIEGFCLGAKDIGTRGVFLTGILPEKENRMNDLSSRLIKGEMFSADDNYAVIAEGVATQLELSTGDTLVLIGQGFQGMTAAGKYKVGGILEFPLPEQNNTMVYLPLKEAQYFFAAPDRLNRLIMMMEDEREADRLAQQMQNDLDDDWYTVKTWEQLMPDKVAAFEARDAQVKVFVWVLYIVAGFGILGTVITMMHERLREFGILLSIGLKRTQLAIICMLETIFISFIGVITGVVVGFPVIYRLHKNPIPITDDDLKEAIIDFGLEPVFSFSAEPGIFIYQAVTIFLIAIIVGLYPVQKVFRLEMTDSASN